MGRMKKKTAIPLSLFYLKYFIYIFIYLLLLAILLLITFNFLMMNDILYPANQAEKQAISSYETIRNSDKITKDLIPDLCDYIIFQKNGAIVSSSLSKQESDTAWEAVINNKTNIGRYYYFIIPHDTEYCVLRYTFSLQYKSPFLREHFLTPQLLFFLTASLSSCIGIMLIATRFGRTLNKKLSPLTMTASKIEHQELDFNISTSGIKEIDAILNSIEQMRVALKNSLEQQWQIEQQKNEQISAFAHDLKTPLTIVRGNAELLLESTLSPQQRNYVNYIESSSLQMQNYVQTLIDVTKSYKEYPFRKQTINCTLFFEEIKQQIQALCSVNHISFIWNCDYKSNDICIDPDLFMRAIINIVANSIDYTPFQGSITFSIYEKENHFSFVVLDTGKGFSKEALKHGTEQFFMDDTSRNSNSHFGIGLYFANSIIQKHGGQLLLENSIKTGGAKVSITIPCSLKRENG